MTKIYKTEHIEQAMTEKVMQYISDGYRVDMFHSNGSQGERAKVILTKGDEYIAIYIDRDYVSLNDDVICRMDDVTVIRVMKQTGLYKNSTFWLNQGDMIDEVIFYSIGDRYDDEVFTTDKEFAKAVKAKRYERRWAKQVEDRRIKPTAKVLKVLKNHWGYKSLKVEDVDYIVRRNNKNFCTGEVTPAYEIYFKDWTNKNSILV